MEDIRYIHEYNQRIKYSEEQALTLGTYRKQIFSSDRIDLEIDFKENTAIHVSVYLYNGENSLDILPNYTNKYNSISLIWRELLHSCYWNDYCEDYTDGEVKFKAKDLLSFDWEEVCTVDLDLDTGNPELESTEKYFTGPLLEKYNNKIYDSDICFYYDKLGEIKHIWVSPGPITHKRDTSMSFTEFKYYYPNFFSENSYYQNAEFLPCTALK